MTGWKFANSDGKSFMDISTDYRSHIGSWMVHPNPQGTAGYYLGKTLFAIRGYAQPESVFECFYLKRDVMHDMGGAVCVKRLRVIREHRLLRGKTGPNGF